MKAAIAIFTVILGLQIAFWYHTHDIVPDMSIVPNVPGEDTVQALSLGDSQAFFRVLGLQIQNAGDTFGRFTALKKYDYNKLYHWFRLLDQLDDDSNYIPSMATYYFSQTQNTKDVKYVVDYLIEHSAHRPDQKWWWLVQAIYLAGHKLEDQDLALKVATPLTHAKNVPVWVKQMPAFVYEKRGEMGAALKIIEGVLENTDKLSQGELNFMRYFVEERLDKLKEIEHKLDKAEQDKAIQEALPKE